MAIKESGEMYLETILILSRNGKKVRSIDISDYMNFSKPSVSRAIGILKNNEYINIDNDGYITLTDTGEALAESIYDRHTYITQMLISIGVSQKQAEQDACRIEHVISEETFDAIKKHMDR